MKGQLATGGGGIDPFRQRPKTGFSLTEPFNRLNKLLERPEPSDPASKPRDSLQAAQNRAQLGVVAGRAGHRKRFPRKSSRNRQLRACRVETEIDSEANDLDALADFGSHKYR